MVEMPKQGPLKCLEELIEAAKAGSWDAIDESIEFLATNTIVVDWAEGEGLIDQNQDLRDLAASVLEETPHELRETTVPLLLNMMKHDAYVYARYRAAFALFNHEERSPEVVNVLLKAASDDENPDVKEIATGYLEEIRESSK